MRNRGDVTNDVDRKSRGLQRTKSGLSPGSRPLDVDLDTPHPRISGFASRAFCGNLSGKRSPLPGTFETDRSGTRPRHHVPLRVSNADDRIIKRRMNAHHSFGNCFAGFLFPWCSRTLCRSCFRYEQSPLSPSTVILLALVFYQQQFGAVLCGCASWCVSAVLVLVNFSGDGAHDMTQCPDVV